MAEEQKTTIRTTDDTAKLLRVMATTASSKEFGHAVVLNEAAQYVDSYTVLVQAVIEYLNAPDLIYQGKARDRLRVLVGAPAASE